MSTDDTNAARRGSESNDLLGPMVNRALFADECQRLAEWALIGPVQRAALESFAERLLAAERDHMRDLCSIDMAQATLKASELAQAAERERCARVALEQTTHPEDPNNEVWQCAYNHVANQIADAIRKA